MVQNHGSHFEGERTTFGANVRYLPNKTKQERKGDNVIYKDKQAKWDSMSRLGVFCGYRMKNGSGWTKRHQVWDLDAFLDVNLRSDVEFSQMRGVKPHEVRRIRMPPGEIQFPLLNTYL